MDRRWLYGGLAAVAGVGLARLVRRGPKIVPGGTTRLLVIGGAFATGLAPPLRSLAGEQKVPFDAVLPPNGGAKPPLRTEEWARRPELAAMLATFKATLVAVSLDAPATDGPARAKQAVALKDLLTAIQAAGAEVVWIGPPVAPPPGVRAREPSARYFPTGTALTLPRGPDGVQPTVAGYAGWAGAIWQWLS
jgi:hypothetical protein